MPCLRPLTCCAIVLVLAAVASAQTVATVRALFLGDQGHHRPVELFKTLEKPLAEQGIRLRYREDLGVLDPVSLAETDVLVLYANLGPVGPEREKALFDWVERGGGFVGLHCASACFGGTEGFVRFLGGEFARHGGGVFRAEIVDHDHPITRGLMAFASWDETYVHRRIGGDLTVLAERRDGEQREPWTWVRTHGRGRIFYTASGHDERTWREPGYHELVARGTRFAAGERFAVPPVPLPALETAEAEVPEYRQSGERRPASGKPKGRLQKPLSPEDSARLHVVPADFTLRLFASEPMIQSPLAMAFDARGRLWLAESLDYPNELAKDGRGRDRIIVLDDDDHDGVADRATTFAEGLSLPTSLCFAGDGVIVHTPPRTIRLSDTDGDGRADRTTVLLEGWGTGDTHAGPSNLRYGLDGWIYGTVGYSGFDGEVAGRRLRFGSSVYRFLPDGSRLEVLSSTSNNTWGLGLDETGEIFCSTANNDVCNYLGIPNRVYEGVRGWHGHGLAMIARYREMHPITEDVRQVDWHGRYTAAAGAAITADARLPAWMAGRHALICEPTGHLVHLSRLVRDGSSFAAEDGYNLFESRDAWCAPIAAEAGPDGALWILDWYSPVVQHNPTPHGFENGAGNAYVTPHRDRERARVWRVVPKGLSPEASGDLAKGDDGALLAALEHPNLLVRLHAQRLLVERGGEAAIPELRARLAVREGDGPGSATRVLHAACALHGLGELSRTAGEPLLPLLRHPEAAVRKIAVKLAPRTTEFRDRLLAAGLLSDADALVRRETLLALGAMPPSKAAGEAVFAALQRGENAADRWIVDAATAAAACHAEGFLAKAVTLVPEAPAASGPNLLPNPGFEDTADRGGVPVAPPWRVRTYSGRAEHEVLAAGRGGGMCLRIASSSGADTSFHADVPVEPATTYRLSGWIRSAELEAKGGALGAMLNVHGRSPEEGATTRVRGSGGFREVELVFTTRDDEREVSINCLFGGWGHATGTAWFDDVRLVRVDGAGRTPERALRIVTGVVTRHLARGGDAESVRAVLAAARTANRALRAELLVGLEGGLPEREGALFLDEEGLRVLDGIATDADATTAEAAFALARKLGAAERYRDGITRRSAALVALVGDAAAAPADRSDAATRLLRLDDGPPAWSSLVAVLGAALPPEVAQGILAALGTVRDPALGAALVARLPELGPAARKPALELLLKRPAWTKALLEAMEAGTLGRAELDSAQWERVRLQGDGTVRELAATLDARAGVATSSDRAAVLERLLPLAERQGDRERGRKVFTRLCASCHRIGGEGCHVAPELDGVGQRARRDILTDIVDPNRSWESTYQLWLVFTKEDETLSGRLVSETLSSLELLDSGDVRRVVPRDTIDSLRAAGKSAMPEGLVDTLPEEDLRGLLEFLGSSKERKH